ncbi:MAG: FMN-binding protein [Planctomycetota bacterium]|nr:FMN-binding protein [Planctomycetota bacterium]
MSDPTVERVPQQSQPSVVQMYAAVMGVGIGCALAIVVVYESTKPIIERKRAVATQQAILDVLPRAVRITAFRWDGAQGRFVQSGVDSDTQILFAGYDEADHLVGLAIGAEGTGYQDTIRVLYGYSFERQAVIGLRVLESRETPGLGDRVETDAAFKNNFTRLDVQLAPGKSALAHPVEFVKPNKKRLEWQIDGMSGATVTSSAIAEMIGKSTAKWIPRVHQHRSDFTFNSGSSATSKEGWVPDD